MKYIWTLVLLILLTAGSAMAQVDEPGDADEIILYDTFMDASLYYLWDETLTFDGAWGDADAYAGRCPFEADPIWLGTDVDTVINITQ